MPENNGNATKGREPLGFTQSTSGLASEYAREQGWDINEEERSQTPMERQEYDGGTDYDYGARDFGDSPVDTSGAAPQKKERQNIQGKEKVAATGRQR